MSTCGNEDQDQRKNGGKEDSNSMTVEFLRARLLSERSISKTARQRADELAKRVAELEDQLMFVSRQRKKAEKATSDVLSILENRGFSDMPEGFDSFSDEDEIAQDNLACNASVMILDGPADMKILKNEVEAYSSSEFEYSQSTDRSLSWKSTKNSQYSLEKKKRMDSVRRRASVVSSSSSIRRAGKSCRKVRHKETRSPEEVQSDGLEQVTCGTDVSNCSDCKQYESRKYGGCVNVKSTENSILCSNNETPKSNRHYFNGHKSYEDMDSALQHQLQLIGQYEAEEKAQREWEENFRENIGHQDSCDPGNHSDVTEERYEMMSAELSYGAGPSSSNRETKHELVDACSSEEPQTSRSLLSHPSSDKAGSQDKLFCGTVACEPLRPEFSFPTSRNTDNLYYPRRPHDGSTELVGSPQQDSKNLGSVLDALQKAKLSLHQKLNSSAPVTVEASKSQIDNMDRFKVPLTSPGLFRLPTADFLLQATARNNHPNERSSSAEIGGRRFLSESLANSRTSFSGANHPDFRADSTLSPEFSKSRSLCGHYVYSDALFHTETPRTVTTGNELRPPQHMYMGQPEPAAGSAYSSRTLDQLDPYTGMVLPFDRTSYKYAPEYP